MGDVQDRGWRLLTTACIHSTAGRQIVAKRDEAKSELQLSH